MAMSITTLKTTVKVSAFILWVLTSPIYRKLNPACAVFTQSLAHVLRMEQWPRWPLAHVLVPDDLPSLDLDLLVEPLAVAAALGAALVGAALGAGVEAAQAILVQAVTQVHPAVQQQPLAVIHLALGWNYLPVQ